MNNEFGAALRTRRREAKITQRDLAKQIGVDFSYISKIENGRLSPPAADTVLKICEVLGSEPEELLALTGKIPSEVQEAVSQSQAAQEFLREAQRIGLTESEWQTMTKSLKGLRSDT